MKPSSSRVAATFLSISARPTRSFLLSTMRLGAAGVLDQARELGVLGGGAGARVDDQRGDVAARRSGRAPSWRRRARSACRSRAGGACRRCRPARTRGRRTRTACRSDRAWCRARRGPARAPRRAGGSPATTCRRWACRRTPAERRPGAPASRRASASPSSSRSSPSRSRLGLRRACSSSRSSPRATLLARRARAPTPSRRRRAARRCRGRATPRSGTPRSKPEREDLGDRGLAPRRVDLVGGDEDRLARRRSTRATSSSTEVMPSRASTTNTITLGLVDGAQRLRAHRLEDPLGRRVEAAGVDDAEARAVPLALAVAAIARHAGHVLDERGPPADQPVEQRRLADVGAADERARAAACGRRRSTAGLDFDRALRLHGAYPSRASSLGRRGPVGDDLDHEPQVHRPAEQLADLLARASMPTSRIIARPCRRRCRAGCRARRGSSASITTSPSLGPLLPGLDHDGGRRTAAPASASGTAARARARPRGSARCGR